MAYLRTADFCGGLKSGLILLTLGGFLDFYSGNTGNKSFERFVFILSDLSDL